jgi:hypothetical protein
MSEIIVEDKLCIFPMKAAWTYLPIPDHKVPGGFRGGWGSIPVVATIGQTTWKTSLFPMKGKKYFIPIKKTVCQTEKLLVGQKVKVSYKPIHI